MMQADDTNSRRRPTVAQVQELQRRLRATQQDAERTRLELATMRERATTYETELTNLRSRLHEDPEAEAIRVVGDGLATLWQRVVEDAGWATGVDDRTAREEDGRRAVARVLALVGDRFDLVVDVRPRPEDEP